MRFWFSTTKAWFIYGHRGVSHVFYKLFLFYRVFTKLQVAFYHLKKIFFEIWPVKVGCITGSLWDGKTKTTKKVSSFSSHIFQAFFFKLSQYEYNLYTMTKKPCVGLKKTSSRNIFFMKKKDFFLRFQLNFYFFNY